MPELPAELVATPATFETLTGPALTVAVHFNPASLEYTVSNTLKEEGEGGEKKQYVSQTTAKLTMDLVFDTTDSGEDVRTVTNRMAKLLQPVDEGANQHVPPTVRFAWGAYAFTGMVEQYKETIDFFAAGGVPLRAAINLTLVTQDVVFEAGTSGERATVDAPRGAEPRVVPDAGGAQALANALGDPRAARGIAAASGAASLRFSAGGGLAVGASTSVGFAAGASVGTGFSAGIGATVGGGAGAGFSAAAGGGFSADAHLLPAATFATGVSAGTGAGAGFVNLRSATGVRTRPLDASRLPAPAAGPSGGAGVAAGGRLIEAGGSAGLRADVGAEADFVIGRR